MGITSKHYNSLQKAYAFLNKHLFDDALPAVLITLQRENQTYGYYWHQQFSSRTEDGETVDEIALNPANFRGRSDREIISTLAHEMCHVWQHYAGTPSRAGYHNSEWADKMDSIGLKPCSSDGKGRRTGQGMTHTIVVDGQFDKVFTRLVSQRSWRLEWEARRASSSSVDSGEDTSEDGDGDGDGTPAEPKKAVSKMKFTCPKCKQNAWAKPSALLICGLCYAETEAVVTMLDASL